LDPVWNEYFEWKLKGDPSTSILSIEAWDYDKHSSDDPLGYKKVSLGELIKDQPTPVWLKLDGAASGEVKIEYIAHGWGIIPDFSQEEEEEDCEETLNGELLVTVIGATDLIAGDRGYSNPFVRIRVARGHPHNTRTISKVCACFFLFVIVK